MNREEDSGWIVVVVLTIIAGFSWGIGYKIGSEDGMKSYQKEICQYQVKAIECKDTVTREVIIGDDR